MDEPALTRILLSYTEGLDPAFEKKIRSFYSGIRDYFQATLKEGQRLGLIAKGDARLQALFTIGALKEVLLESATHRVELPREELVQAFYRHFQSGFLRMPERR